MAEQLDLRPDAYSQRNPLIGSPTGATGVPVVVLIGRTNGALLTLTDEAKTKGAQGSTETVAHTIEDVLRVSLQEGGLGDYTISVDFQVSGLNGIQWLGTKMVPVADLAAAGVTTGGTLNNGTYYYVITAYRITTVAGPVYGETLKSNEVSVTFSGLGSPTGRVVLTWTPVPLAEGYKIFRGTAAGVYTDKLIYNLTGGSNSTFIDTGYATGTGTPPVTNTAYREPATGSTYYASYTYLSYTYQQFTRFYDLQTLQNANGVDSAISKAATLVMGPPGRGQGAGVCGVIGVAADNDSDFINALVVLANYGKGESFLIAPLRSSSTLFSAVKAHVELLSNTENMSERFAFLGQKEGDVLGDISTPGSLIYNARNLADRRVALTAEPYVITSVLQLDSSYADEHLDGFFYAAALAGRCAALSKSSDSLTNKIVQGVNELGVIYNETQKKTAVLNGLIVSEFIGPDLTVRRGISTDTSTVENMQISITLADDDLARSVRAALKPLVGGDITDDLLTAAVQLTRGVFNAKKKTRVIRDYDPNTLVPSQGTGSQSTWVFVRGTYKAIYPAEVLLFQYGIDLRQ